MTLSHSPWAQQSLPAYRECAQQEMMESACSFHDHARDHCPPSGRPRQRRDRRGLDANRFVPIALQSTWSATPASKIA